MIDFPDPDRFLDPGENPFSDEYGLSPNDVLDEPKPDIDQANPVYNIWDYNK